MLFFLLPILARGTVQVAADGNLLLGEAHVDHGLRTWQIHTDGVSRKRVGEVPSETGPPTPNELQETWVPNDLKILLQAVKANAEKKGQNKGSARSARVGNVTLPMYVLTSAGTRADKRRDRLRDKYSKHFGLDPAQWDNMWFHSVPTEILVDKADESNPDPHAKYKIKREFARAFAAGVENYLIPQEVSHYVSFLFFLSSVVESGHDRAFFLEDDINFIPIVEHSVFHNGELVPWDQVPEQIGNAEKYEYSSDEFQRRFSNSIAAMEADGASPDVLYVGSIFNNGDTLATAQGPDAKDRSIAVPPSCSDGTHALIISNVGARKLLSKMFPIWLRTDSSIFSTEGLTKKELIPNLVGQRKYWEIYKEVKSSTLSSFMEHSASFRMKLAMGICIPAWDWAEYAVTVRQDLYFMGVVYIVLAFAMAFSCIDRWRKSHR